MGGILGCLACNAASCVCKQMCSACSSATSNASSIVGKVIYAIILLLSAIAAFLLKNLPSWIDQSTYLSWIPGFHGCKPSSGGDGLLDVLKGLTPNLPIPESICYGTMSVYRISAALAVFHLILTLVMINVRNKKDPRDSIQNSWWSIKLIVLAGLTVGSFFIPNVVFVPYSWIALIGSGVFILIQLLYLVDFAHTWTESWIGKHEESVNTSGSKVWGGLLVACTVLLYIISIVLTTLMFVYWTSNEKDCWFNSMFIIINLILCLFMSAFSVHPKIQDKNPRVGLLQASVVTCYTTYLVWSALSSEPSSMKCSTFPLGQGDGGGVSLVVGLVFTFLALLYSVLRVSSQVSDHDDEDPRKLITNRDSESASEEELKDATELEEEGESDKKITPPPIPEIELIEEDERVDYNYSFFHLTFVLAAMYIAMLFTNWGSVSSVTGDQESQNTILVDQGMAAVWVKAVSSWITLIIYGWTLVAPILFPNRFHFLGT